MGSDREHVERKQHRAAESRHRARRARSLAPGTRHELEQLAVQQAGEQDVARRRIYAERGDRRGGGDELHAVAAPEGKIPLAIIPSIVAAADDDVDFLLEILAHVGTPQPARRRIKGHALGIAQSDRPELGAYFRRVKGRTLELPRAHERIVRRDCKRPGPHRGVRVGRRLPGRRLSLIRISRGNLEPCEVILAIGTEPASCAVSVPDEELAVGLPVGMKGQRPQALVRRCRRRRARGGRGRRSRMRGGCSRRRSGCVAASRRRKFGGRHRAATRSRPADPPSLPGRRVA